MLWICLRLPHLAVELRQPPEPGAIAISDGAGARRLVIACNTAALAAGVAVGMNAPSSLMRAPDLRLLNRCKSAERRAVIALASWAHQFSSDVYLDVHRWMLWLEVGSSLRYFNGLATIHARIKAGIERLGYSASLGIAPTLEAAALLTHHPELLPILGKQALRPTIGVLPLDGSTLGPKVTEQLRSAGLQTFEDLLNIPAAALGRRFGEALPSYLQKLMGEQADVRIRHRAPVSYRRRFQCLEPIASVEAILFPLRRMLQEFEGYLRGRDCAVHRLAVKLLHRGRAETVLELATSAPQRDAVRLFALLRERLERTQLTDQVNEIHLSADEFVEPRILQSDFFDDQQHQNDNWSALLDKLSARLGPDAIRHLGLSNDHRPEKAWCVLSEETPASEMEAHPDRPLWLLEKPTLLGDRPDLIGSPERIEAGWWAGSDSSRDYYLARSPDGGRWWVYNEAGTHRWYLQGLWA